MKLHYFFNGKVFLTFDENYTRISGYLYTVSAVKHYAKKYGWEGVKKVNYSFVEESFRREEVRHLEAQRVY